MGLSVSHGCWEGGYISFMIWRTKLAEVAGFPPLRLMEGYCDSRTFRLLELDETTVRKMYPHIPISWEAYKHDPLVALLDHSDSGGEIPWKFCKPLADRLKELLPRLEGDGGGHVGNYREKTQTFIDGLMRAHKKKQKVEFS